MKPFIPKRPIIQHPPRPNCKQQRREFESNKDFREWWLMVTDNGKNQDAVKCSEETK